MDNPNSKSRHEARTDELSRMIWPKPSSLIGQVSLAALMACLVLPCYLLGSHIVWRVARQSMFPGALIATALLVAALALFAAYRLGPLSIAPISLGSALGGWISLLVVVAVMSWLAGKDFMQVLGATAASSLRAGTPRFLTLRYVAYPLVGAAGGLAIGLVIKRIGRGPSEGAAPEG